MDTSKEYVAMCEKAGEIRDSWIPSQGDTYQYGMMRPCNIDIGSFVIKHCETGIHFLENLVNAPAFLEVIRKLYIWLPRQDQLQYMVFGNGKYGARQWDVCKEHGSLVNKIVKALKEFGIPAIGTVDEKWSMEQLWLAFVMRERYKKKWSGEDWVEEEK